MQDKLLTNASVCVRADIGRHKFKDCALLSGQNITASFRVQTQEQSHNILVARKPTNTLAVFLPSDKAIRHS